MFSHCFCLVTCILRVLRVYCVYCVYTVCIACILRVLRVYFMLCNLYRVCSRSLKLVNCAWCACIVYFLLKFVTKM